jgi:hypothetical protein
MLFWTNEKNTVQVQVLRDNRLIHEVLRNQVYHYPQSVA